MTDRKLYGQGFLGLIAIILGFIFWQLHPVVGLVVGIWFTIATGSYGQKKGWWY